VVVLKNKVPKVVVAPTEEVVAVVPETPKSETSASKNINEAQ
jgi:hypothetical protein